MADLLVSKVDALELAEKFEFERFYCFVTLHVVADDADRCLLAGKELILFDVDRGRAFLGAEAENATDFHLDVLRKIEIWEFSLRITQKEGLCAA